MRAILLALLARGRSQIRNILDSPDTEKLLKIGAQLGAVITCSDDGLMIEGLGQKFNPVDEPLEIGNSGILRRFLTAILAIAPHRYHLVGDSSVMARPMGTLQQALQRLDVQFFADGSFQGPSKSGVTYVNGQDSQPVSALLLSAALGDGETRIHVDGPGELPWVDMTLYWLKFLNIDFERKGYTEYVVRGKKINCFDYTVPGDYSTAAFPYVASIITHGQVELLGLDPDDVQGDKAFLEMGILEGGVFDLNACIDAVPIAAVLACFAKKPVTLTNISIARTKECDRLRAMKLELVKMGARVQEHQESLVIEPASLKGATVDSHGDHRIAMALSVAGLAAAGSTIVQNSACVEKTFPGFVKSFQELGAHIRD